MKVVQLSTYDLYGGAALAAWRLHRALRRAGEDSRLLVQRRQATEADVVLSAPRWMQAGLRARRRLDRLPLTWEGARAREFSLGWLPDGVAAATRRLAPDVVHAHWVADGFLRLESLLKLNVPVVWTLHDMWAFTGGCHYAGACEGFVGRCGRCPLLRRRGEEDFSRSGWIRRRKIFERRPIVFVAPSRWMAEQARRSGLLHEADIRVIGNGIDPARFAPQDRTAARAALGLPQDKVLALAGAMQLQGARKGFVHLVAALRVLRERVPAGTIEIVSFGSANAVAPELEGFRVHHLGVLAGDAALARTYAAADMFVLPSLEDNLPNTALEAMAAGVPVIAHAVGGVADLIDHGENGLLVTPAQPEELAAALARMANGRAMRESFGARAREKVLRVFDAAKIAETHRALYREIAARR